MAQFAKKLAMGDSRVFRFGRIVEPRSFGFLAESGFGTAAWNTCCGRRKTGNVEAGTVEQIKGENRDEEDTISRSRYNEPGTGGDFDFGRSCTFGEQPFCGSDIKHRTAR
jgi:hypothetical protein